MVNTSNNPNTQGGQSGTNEPFVKRVEMAIMQYAILNKAQQQGEVTKENLQSLFRGNWQNMSNHFQTCLQTLVREGHLKENGNKYTISDDGREDVQKLQPIVVELTQFVNAGSQGTQQRQGSTQQGMR